MKVVIITPCSKMIFPALTRKDSRKYPETIRDTFGCSEQHFSGPEKNIRKAARNAFGPEKFSGGGGGGVGGLRNSHQIIWVTSSKES